MQHPHLWTIQQEPVAGCMLADPISGVKACNYRTSLPSVARGMVTRGHAILRQLRAPPWNALRHLVPACVLISAARDMTLLPYLASSADEGKTETC